MAYADIGDVAAGNPVTEVYLDQIRANFLASPPDAFTTKGDLFAATAADAGARVAVGTNDDILVADSAQAAGMAWVHQPAARVYNSADFNPTPSTWTTITFDSENYDTDAMHSVSADTGRLTVPTGGGGIYSFGANAEFATGISANAVSVVGLRILLNGTTVIAQDRRSTYRAETINLNVCLSSEYALSAADYIEVQALTVQDIDVVMTSHSPIFWARWERKP